MLDFTRYPDLAARSLAGSVISANDELFTPRQNLITPGPAVHTAGAFGHTGKVYDGWETRRRREVEGTGRSSGWAYPASCTAWSSTRRSSVATIRRGRGLGERSTPRTGQRLGDLRDDLAVHPEAGDAAVGIDGQSDVSPAVRIADRVEVLRVPSGGRLLHQRVPA
jgi:hypothetical protein